jgi:hypothetical protein
MKIIIFALLATIPIVGAAQPTDWNTAPPNWNSSDPKWSNAPPSWNANEQNFNNPMTNTNFNNWIYDDPADPMSRQNQAKIGETNMVDDSGNRIGYDK